MSVSLRLEGDGSRATLTITGRFTAETRLELRPIIKSMERGLTKLDVNLLELESLDSPALGTLLLLRAQTGLHFQDIKLIVGSDAVSDVLYIANFHVLFHIEHRGFGADIQFC